MSVEYGIICALEDEAKIVKNINAFLVKQCGFKKMYKWPDRSIKPIDKPFEIEHYYTQFLKETPGWLFDVTPNYDKVGRVRFSEAKECGWTIFTKPFREDGNEKQDLSEINKFFENLLGAVGFPVLVLHRYTKGEDRL